MDGRYAPIMALILTVDRNMFFWVLAITFFFTLAVVAVVSKGRRWYELVALFMVVYVGSLLVSAAIFTYAIGVPFARLEMVTAGS